MLDTRLRSTDPASTIDLHTHTTASDGSLSPPELIAAARALGLRTMAITDHDTVAGVAPALLAAHNQPIQVLAGVELSATHNGRHLHMLGYGIDHTSPALTDGLRSLVARREARARAMVERLAMLGVPVSWERVRAHGRGSLGRPHIARALVEAGHATDVADAFHRLVGSGSPAYLPSSGITVPEVVALVRAAGGEVALAHALRRGRPLDLPALLPDLRRAGVTGLEVYHSEHDAPAVQALLRLAAEHGLWWSGGSDFHGLAKPLVSLGGVPVPESVLSQGPFRHLS